MNYLITSQPQHEDDHVGGPPERSSHAAPTATVSPTQQLPVICRQNITSRLVIR